MKVAVRLFLILAGLILLASGLFLIAAALDLVPGVGTSLSWLSGQLSLPLAGGALILVALVLLVFGLHRRARPADTVLQNSELGEVRITITAIENMVLRVTQQGSGIKESSRRVTQSPQGLMIETRIKVMPDLELPELSSELQQKIREYIERITGIKVAAVKVLVENIVTDLAIQRKIQK